MNLGEVVERIGHRDQVAVAVVFVLRHRADFHQTHGVDQEFAVTVIITERDGESVAVWREKRPATATLGRHRVPVLRASC